MINRHLTKIINQYNQNRLMSVDVLRGVAIFMMILVNNPGSWSHQYAPLAHAQWHGWTLTDLVFPFFLFIVGISIALSFSSSKFKTKTTWQQHQILLTRTAKLILLGWFLGLFYYNFYNPEFSWINDRLLAIRWFGVLQRIALVYLVCSLLFIYCKPSTRFTLLLMILISYWIAMMLVSYQDSAGNIYQGLLDADNNLAAYIDHHLFGQTHLYHKNKLPFASDPEGLLTTLPAIASGLSGVLIAEYVLLKQDKIHQIKQLLIIGILSVVMGYLLSLSIPVNKNLWTPSYVFLSSGLAILTLAFCIYLLEIKKQQKWSAPFIVFGSNAIALFMLSGVVARIIMMIKVSDLSLKQHIYSWLEWLTPYDKTNSLIFALLFMLVMYLPIYWMYKRQLFWKV
ncbi:MAG: heparan-alpha-glucosaminide N-acetyltransferase domain-containing protein [Gammaproteobacteria bacterium]|nr:heparan-alpha-glucosaminide N-acetyltransferase domain-containing protein [Gammaproteobacteria bacterium]